MLGIYHLLTTYKPHSIATLWQTHPIVLIHDFSLSMSTINTFIYLFRVQPRYLRQKKWHELKQIVLVMFWCVFSNNDVNVNMAFCKWSNNILKFILLQYTQTFGMSINNASLLWLYSHQVLVNIKFTSIS